MARFWITALLSLMAAGTGGQTSPPAVPSAPPPGYALVWSDEFSVDGRPDATNWTYESGFVTPGAASDL